MRSIPPLLLLLYYLAIFSFGLICETHLGGGYYLNDYNADHRWISKRAGHDDLIVIDMQVTGVRKFAGYVLVRRMIAISYECSNNSGERTIMTHRTNKEEYWIIDTYTEKEMGPFDEFGLESAARKLQIVDTYIPNQVSYKSNSHYFESRVSQCVKLEII
ncbi:hypothetical protein EHLJMEHL_02087 [Vreelandella titanicae]